MSGDDFPEHPPKPRLTLRVAVTGKRLIPAGERERIKESLSGVFGALGDILARIHRDNSGFFTGQPPLLRIICGMAEGSDQLAADVASKRHADEVKSEREKLATREIETRIAAILPFAKAEFENDFWDDPERPKGPKRTDADAQPIVDEFNRLLKDDAIESVLEIDDEALLSTKKKEHRDRAYSNLRDLLLEHADLVVAVSDDKYGGAGGTVDVIGIASGLEIPLVKISTLKREIYLMRAAELDAADQTPREDEEFKLGQPTPPKLINALGHMLNPPAPAAVPSGSEGEHRAHDEFNHARARLESYFKKGFAPAGFGWVFRKFRDLLVAKRREGEPVYAGMFEFFHAIVRRYNIERPGEAARKLWPATHDTFSNDKGRTVREVLGRRFGWADALAVRYADATRSAYVLIAFIGAVAVLAGLLPLFAEKHPGEWKVAALFLEGVILAIAGFWLFKPAHKDRWHQRMIEYRAVAELLRHQRFIYALGSADRLERTADRTWREPDAWVGWYVRATMRELGFPSTRLCSKHRADVLASFREEELVGKNGQINYNQSVAERFETLDERLGKLVTGAFTFTLMTAVVGVAVLGSIILFECFQLTEHESAEHNIHVLKPYFTIIMAFVPALIAAAHGIRFQMEFDNTAKRTAATRRELMKIADNLAASGTAPGRKYCVSYVRLANEAMSSDLAGWSNVYRGKAPEPP